MRSFPICQEVLNISQIAIHHFSSNPDCSNTAEVPSFTLRTALSAMPFVSDRRGVEVRWFHDRSSEDLPNFKEMSVWITFGLCDGSRNFLWTLFVSCEVFFFCTDKIESIEWQDLELRQRTRDSSVIHLPRGGLCDPSLSSHQTFLLEVELRQCVFCKKPLSYWFASWLRNFGLLESEYKCCASWILMSLS